jgi:hypothetical protein
VDLPGESQVLRTLIKPKDASIEATLFVDNEKKDFQAKAGKAVTIGPFNHEPMRHGERVEGHVGQAG